MGKLFQSYGEAWDFFLSRDESLEWFFGDFPEDEDFVAEGWLVEPSQAIKDRAAGLQQQLAQFSWLQAVPDHFLHVWFAGPMTLGKRPLEWRGGGEFEIEYHRVNCFHSAVVVEAHAERLHTLVDGTALELTTFLPHMTIAVTQEEHDPQDLRRVLMPLREERLGAAVAAEAKRVRFPAARTTLFRPWEVVERVPF